MKYKKTIDKVCWYVFLSYFLSVVFFGVIAWLGAFWSSDMRLLDPYSGRAEMYMDYMYE